jgi:hypothetical protein
MEYKQMRKRITYWYTDCINIFDLEDTQRASTVYQKSIMTSVLLVDFERPIINDDYYLHLWYIPSHSVLRPWINTRTLINFSVISFMTIFVWSIYICIYMYMLLLFWSQILYFVLFYVLVFNLLAFLLLCVTFY